MTSFDGEVERIDLNYDGAHPLKGVMGGASYPVFWVNMSGNNSLAVKEDKLRAQTVANREDVKEFCDAFYQEYASFTFRPFIKGDVGQTMAKMPQWYAEYHALLVKNFYLPDNEYSLDGTDDAPEEPGNFDQEKFNEILLDLGLADKGEVSTLFAVGDNVSHGKFGEGRVLSVDGHRVEVSFEDVGVKRVHGDFLAHI